MSAKIETIACKCGNVFSACSMRHIDTEWKINKEVYRLQGCIIKELYADEFRVNTNRNCCAQRSNLFHMDKLLTEFREEIEIEIYEDDDDDDDDDDDE